MREDAWGLGSRREGRVRDEGMYEGETQQTIASSSKDENEAQRDVVEEE